MKIPEPTRLPSGNWRIRMRLGGQSVSVTKRSKTACVRAAQLIKAEHIAGKRAVSTGSLLTMSEAIDAYLTAKKNTLSPVTVRGYRIIQRNRFQKYMNRPIQSIKNWQVVYDSEIGRLNPKTLHNSFGLLKTVYRFTIGQPMPSVVELPVPKAERNFLDADQIQVFLDAVRGKPCEVAALLALSSLRCSEILGLTWDRVDLKKDVLTVHGAAVLDENNQLVMKRTNKTNASWRYVPIFIGQLHDALAATKQNAGPVVHYKTESGMIRAFYKVCQDAGLPLCGPHSLRHSYASVCVHLGIPEETAMSIGGWSDFTTMRKIYTHISQRDRNDHIRELTAFYKNAHENAHDGLEA